MRSRVDHSGPAFPKRSKWIISPLTRYIELTGVMPKLHPPGHLARPKRRPAVASSEGRSNCTIASNQTLSHSGCQLWTLNSQRGDGLLLLRTRFCSFA
jgi:hypothetical protein